MENVEIIHEPVSSRRRMLSSHPIPGPSFPEPVLGQESCRLCNCFSSVDRYSAFL